VVIHAKTGRRLSYGEIAAFAEIPAKAPEVAESELKKPDQFRLIGKDVMRVELPQKVNGTAQYAIDVQVPGMLYGAILRAPVEGAAPDKIDEGRSLSPSAPRPQSPTVSCGSCGYPMGSA
jgi:isoquinoline 1-oxidoreductase beta subunit